MIAERLRKVQVEKPPLQNRYKTWIDNYVADDYCAAMEKGCGKSAAIEERMHDLISVV